MRHQNQLICFIGRASNIWHSSRFIPGDEGQQGHLIRTLSLLWVSREALIGVTQRQEGLKMVKGYPKMQKSF